MKQAATLLLYLATVLLLGALLAPPLFWSAQSLAGRGTAPWLAQYGFETFFDRALLVAALLLLWPLFRALDIHRWRDLGLEKDPRPATNLVAGFLLAAIPLLCCGAFLVLFHVYSLRPAILWAKMPAVIGAAIFAPVVEEILFRGFILGMLLRSWSKMGAVIFTSALFSIVHFLKPPEIATADRAVTWLSGFVSISRSFHQFADPLLVLAGFLTLFLVALILADARLLTRALWLPIGLHAGWIFSNGFFSRTARLEKFILPWLGKDLLVGIVPLTIALLSWALMRGWVRHVRVSRV